ncbi:XIAP-associated factor 1 [Cheilinus undulatus]|uniref:XIAP-associated factor 1 n=1 Tax=Cheilinus undulatus TaxID=241271 RepID=UPI001BD2E037|nr:XIAP-associated factor 1 [Cheilinus undulatus]
MENEEGTRTCKQCHKQVAEANFALHETHCSRFLCVCPDCDEAVPRDQLKQHREEQHTQVRCSKCHQKMERCHLPDHETDECVERLESCNFCELEMPFKELNEHSLACGSRTELCRDCGRYVTLRDQPKHALTCSETDNTKRPLQSTRKSPPINAKMTVKCRKCSASFPQEAIKKHELLCILATSRDDKEPESEKKGGQKEDYSKQEASTRLNGAYKATYLSDRAGNGPWGGGGDPYQISTCPHCHLALPLPTLRRHEVKCRVHVLLN